MVIYKLIIYFEIIYNFLLFIIRIKIEKNIIIVLLSFIKLLFIFLI